MPMVRVSNGGSPDAVEAHSNTNALSTTLTKSVKVFYVVSGRWNGLASLYVNGVQINRASHWYGPDRNGYTLSISTFTGSFKKGDTISFSGVDASAGWGVIY